MACRIDKKWWRNNGRTRRWFKWCSRCRRLRAPNHVRTIFLLTAACTLGCGLFDNGLDYELRRAIIDPNNDYKAFERPIIVPEEASVGEPVTIKVMTFGNMCALKGHTEVSVEALVATIEPFDWTCVGGTPDRGLKHFEHTIRLQYAEPGQATVWIVGLITPADTLGRADFSITVQ